MIFRSFVIIALFTGASLVIFATGCSKPAAQNGQVAKPQAESPAAKPVELKITDFDGIQQTVAAHRGQIVVMDAWSTSCEPCIREFPNLVALSKKHGDRLACISLSFDYEGLGKPEDQREPVLAFLRQQQATFENLLSSDDSEKLYTKFKLASLPAVFVYDQQGKLAHRFEVESGKDFTYRDVEAKVDELLRAGG